MKINKTMYAEVSTAISAQVNRGEIVNLALFTASFVSSKSDVTGGDLDFYKTCAFSVVQEIASSCIGKYASKSQSSSSSLLPGFDRLQLAYPVVRNGDQLLVPVELMTDDEIFERASEYDAKAKGLKEHAIELRAFARMRNAANDNTHAVVVAA